jgi:rubrerythrin
MKEVDPRLIDALKYAIQMELDGKKFYTQAGGQSTNPAGKELFSWLAKQEDHHRQTFEIIYKAIADKQGWPAGHVKPDKPVKLGTIFGDAIKNAEKDIKTRKEEVLAVAKAMDMEIKSRDYYKKQAELASSVAEKSFFTAISAEEQGHYLGLVDYKEYITDPVDWFTRTEHHLLDGA